MKVGKALRERIAVRGPPAPAVFKVKGFDLFGQFCFFPALAPSPPVAPPPPHPPTHSTHSWDPVLVDVHGTLAY